MTGMTPESIDELDRIECEASEWLVRIEDGDLDDDGEHDFEAWLDADPRHGEAMDNVRRVWTEVAALDHLKDLAPIELVPVDEATVVTPISSARRWPRFVAGGFAAVAAAVLAFVVVPNELWKPAPHYQTQLAETRIVNLPDGSSVTLGAKTQIKVRYSEAERRVVLTGGEAFFDVVHNAARPFRVEAGNSVVTDIGTKFDVNLTSGTVRVSVLEGAVSVARADDHKSIKPQLLKAGERTEVALVVPELVAASASAPLVTAPPIVALPAQAPGAWREGRLVFDNVRLADLADDVNRYYAPGVLVAGDVRDVRVTASFKTSEIPAFMATLSESFPVRASRGDGGSFEVRGRPR